MKRLPSWFWPCARMVLGSIAIGVAIAACSANAGSSGSNPGNPSQAASVNAAAQASARIEAQQTQTAVPVGTTIVGGVQAPGSAGAQDPLVVVTQGPVTAAPSTVPHGAGPSAVVSVAANSDGCNHDYGTNGQCIPLFAPGGGAMNCAALTSLGYFKTPLQVNIDSLGLMTKPNVKMGLTADGKYMTVSACTDH